MVVTPYFYPEAGGLANYSYNIAKGLQKKYGFEIVILTCRNKNKKESLESLSGMKVYGLSKWFTISNTPVDPLWYFRIKNIIREEDPDLVNAHTPVPFISDITATLCSTIPFILTYHTGSMILKDRMIKDLLVWFYESFILKATLKKVKKIICTSDFIRLNFLKDYIDKTVTVTPGVDRDIFRPKITGSENKILFVGSLKKKERYKGLEYLLSAVSIIKKDIKDIGLVVVGEGDHITYYKRLCENLGMVQNVLFKGRLSGKYLAEQYQGTDITVLPSLSEGFGMVLIEAMACKRPVIGSSIGGIPYIIEDNKNGLLVPPGDPVKLAGAIMKILRNPGLARQMGENGLQKVNEDYTWEKKLKETQDIICECL